MKTSRLSYVCLALLLLCNVSLAQQPKLTWYSFDRDFINNQYSDSAVGELKAKAAFAAKDVHKGNFTFYGAGHGLEEKLIKQALELEGGNVSRAAERLGLKRQTLSNMLRDRHSKLFVKRTPPIPRRKSIIKDK